MLRSQLVKAWLILSVHMSVVKDGTERNIESISLIDAVLPEVIEQRKQGALKGSQLKTEAQGPNGEEGISQHIIMSVVFPSVL